MSISASEPPAWPSLNALFADRVKTKADDVFLCIPKPGYADPGAAFAYDEYTFGEVDRLVKEVAASYTGNIPARQPGAATRVVGLFAPSGFDYVINALALFRLGHTVVYLSTNNSTAALAHLVKVTSASSVLYSSDKVDAAASLKLLLQEQGLGSVQLLQWTTASDAAQLGRAANMHSSLFTSALSYEQESDQIAYCLHSSGSTGFPKPNYVTHKAAIKNISTVTSIMDDDIFTSLPLFHASGQGMFLAAICTGRKFFLYNGRLSAESLAAAIRSSTARTLVVVPFVLKLLSESKAGLRAMQSFEFVMSVGSPCPTETGNRLVHQHNIPLVTFYGSSEAGGLMASFRDFANDKEWEYLRPVPPFKPFMKLENRGTDASGPFELVVGAGWPNLLETNRPDGSYATKDLLVPHATLPNAYKYVGRADDTLVHFNGEKTNPVPMELAMRASPYVADCLVFGAGRSQAGVLVIPSSSALQEARSRAATDAQSDEAAVQHQISKLVWTAVEAGNDEAPSHSQIVPELVKVLPAEARFTAADKGSVIRAKTVKAFEREIDQAYADYEAGRGTNASAVALHDKDASIEVAAQAVSDVTGLEASDLKSKLKDADFVELGVDSLQAARIRVLLRQRVKLASDLPGNLIFEYPSIVALANCLLKHSLGEATNIGDHQQTEVSNTLALLEEFQSQIKARDAHRSKAASQNGAAKHTVVLTGSTGSLGAHILHQLASIKSVETIICLNRAKHDADARKRTEESLLTRKLAPLDVLGSSSNTSILCLASDLAKPNLGLAPASWELVSSKTTCVIHNGWPVNFNMSVQSFRAPIQGSVNLINLAAQSPATSTPRFIFSSSVSTVLASPTSKVDEQYPGDATHALMGYGRSKWIVEKLCSYAQEHVGSGFDAVVARIGQMVGDRRSGVWNDTEAAPLMLKSAQTVGCLPALSEPIAWQPVDDSGFIVANLVVPRRLDGVIHVLNPAVTPFAELTEQLAKPENLGKSFEVVEPSEWVRRLSKSDPDPQRNPTIKLLDHYKSVYGGTKANGAEPNAVQSEARKAFSTQRLRTIFKELGLQRELDSMLVPVDGTLIHSIVAAWKRTGFLK